MIDLSDLDSWKPQKAGAVDLSDLDSWAPAETERDRIKKAKAEALWGGSFDEWKARKDRDGAEQARMVAESEAGNVGSRRAQDFQRQTKALNEAGLKRGEFSAGVAMKGARADAETAIGGLTQAAGEIPSVLADFFGVNSIARLAKQEGVTTENPVSRAGRGIAETGRIRQAEVAPLMVERPESLLSAQGAKYVAQQGLRSLPVTGTGLAASVVNPAIGLGAIGASAGGQKYDDSRQAGKDVWLSAQDAIAASAAEGIPEMLPAAALTGRLLKFMPKGLAAKLGESAVGKTAMTALAEGGSETLTELSNIAYEREVEGIDVTPEEAAQRLIDSTVIGTAMGGVIGGAADIANYRPRERERTPATNGQSLTAPINFTTQAAELTNKILGDSPPTVSAGASLADQAIADAGLNRPSQSPQLTSAAEVDSLLAGVESVPPSVMGGENELAANSGIAGSLGGIEASGRGDGAIDGIAQTGAQFGNADGARGSSGDIATAPGSTVLPDGTTFIPGNPTELRQRLADAGVTTQGFIRTIDGVEGVRFGRDTAPTVLGVFGGSREGAGASTNGSAAGSVPASSEGLGGVAPARDGLPPVVGDAGPSGAIDGEFERAPANLMAADVGGMGAVATTQAQGAVDGNGLGQSQSSSGTGLVQSVRGAEPGAAATDGDASVQSARFPNGTPESLRGLTDPELDQFAGLEAEIVAATSQQGGKAILGEGNNAVGRQTWAVIEPDSGFWRQRTQKITAKEGIAALQKAQAGEKLTRKETNFVNYAKGWARTYADTQTANEVASQSEYRASQRDDAKAEIESTMASVADTSPQQRASVQSLGADYTDQLLTLKRARKAGRLNPDQAEQYMDLLEQDRETGKVAGRPMAGIGNKTAYVDALMEGRLLPVQVFVDADNFKSLNDKFGHDVGDDVIRLLADEMVAEFGEGNVFHRGGDEFLTQGNTQEEADAKMARVQQRLSSLRLELPLSDGRTAVLPGVGVSYGTGSNEKAADDSLKQDKERRKAAGLRTDRRSGDDAGSVGSQPAGSGAQASGTDSRGATAAVGEGGVGADSAVRGIDASGRERSVPDGGVQAQPEKSDGTTVAEARAELARDLGEKFTRRLESQPWFHLVDSLDQIPDKVRKSLTDAESAAGFVHSDGGVYIIAGNIDSNVTGVVLHEVGVHFGMSGILGRDFPAVLAKFRKLKAKGLVSDAYAKVPEGTPDSLIDEEALAYYVQTNWNQDVPLMQRIVDAVKAFLNRMGVPLSKLNASPSLLAQVARGAADKASRGLVTVRNGEIVYHRAFHGSPHDFDKFRLDDSTIGTGEGAQAFGFGLYFAGRKELADHYRRNLSDTEYILDGKPLEDHYDSARDSYGEVPGAFIEFAVDNGFKDAIQLARVYAKDASNRKNFGDKSVNSATDREIQQAILLLEKIEKQSKGKLYEVELAPQEDEYLDWDAPLRVQNDRLREFVKDMAVERHKKETDEYVAYLRKSPKYNDKDVERAQIARAKIDPVDDFYDYLENGDTYLALNDKGSKTERNGELLYRLVSKRLGGDRAASAALHAAGIPGIRYLDGSSRGAGDGSRNYVIFDDSSVSVVNKYSRAGDGGSSTIKVDGKDRPTTDSTGKRIHPTDEGLVNFWRWFSDSKVADDQGRPLVVYHGTSAAALEAFDASRIGANGRSEGAGFYFTTDEVTARGYGQKGHTVPAYMRVTKPLSYDASPFGQAQIRRLIAEAANAEAADTGESWKDGFLANYADTYNKSFDSVVREASDSFTNEDSALDQLGGLIGSGVDPDTVNKALAKSLGYDGYRSAGYSGEGKKGGVIWVAIQSEQIKSATGNTGAFNPKDPRIAYSRNTPRTAAQETALAKAGMPEDHRTLAQRGKGYIATQWGNVKSLASMVTIDGALDRFHRMSSIEQELGVPVERSAYVSARLAAGLPSIMEGVMMYGAPKWDGGVLSVDDRTVGLLDALAPVKDDINGWLGWMVGRRAKVLKAQGRENLMDDADIQALLSLSKGREQEFEDAALKYLRIKKAILDVAEKAGLIDPAARATWDSVEYIPFYRQDETEGDTIGPGTRKGLDGQTSGIRQLKGGQQNLADPLGNIVRNFTKLIDSSLKNNAMLEAVDAYGSTFFERVPMSGTMERIPLSQIKKVLLERGVPQSIIDGMPEGTLTGLTKMWAVKPPSDDDVVRVMRGGKAEYYRVPDKDLLLSLTSFKVKSTSLIVAPLKFFKRLLTAGVTSSPEFMARNFMRDSLSSWVIADDKFAVGWDSVKGVISPLLDKTAQKEMMFAGGSFVGGNFYDIGSDESTAKAIRRALRDKGLKSADIETFMGSIASSPVALWDKWQKVGSYLENANRNAIFENAIKAGRSRKEAAYLARDLMDFSMHGSSAFIQVLSDVLPFFNARLQGLYKLYRQGGKKALRKALLMRAGTVTAMSLSLMAWNMLMYADGYDELEDWDKDTYWHIMPGTKWHIRVPKPFELGVLFATVPERVARAVTYQIPGGDIGDTPKQTVDSFLAQIGGTLAMNPIPQGVMPIVEQWANKRFFTGRPIENMGDDKLLPEARAEWYTSDTAKAISDMIGNKTGLSPKRIEHLWGAYTGTMGAYALDTVDWLVRSVEKSPDRPELAWSEMPLAKALYRGDSPPKNTRYTTEFYDMSEKADQVSGTIKEYLVSGRTEEAAELERENAALLGKKVKSKTAKAGIMFENVKANSKIKEQLAEIRKQIEGIIVMPGVSPEVKRARVEQLTMKRNKLTRDAIAASRRTGR